jgi:NTE family protein
MIRSDQRYYPDSLISSPERLSLTNDKFLLLKRHPCSKNLSNDLVTEIASQCEVIQCAPGETPQQVNQAFHSVYLMIHGRMRQTLYDFQGRIVAERFQVAGEQFGALAAAMGEPAPMELVAEEPSTMLRIDYRTCLGLNQKHPEFQHNFSIMLANTVLKLAMKGREHHIPRNVVVFHQSPESRILTKRLVTRLTELEEQPHVMTDDINWKSFDGVPDFVISANGNTAANIAAIQQKIVEWSEAERLLIDIDNKISTQSMRAILEFADKVLWCVTPENWQQSVAAFQHILETAPGWENKINVVWILPGDCRIAPLAPELNQPVRRNFKLSFETPPAKQNRGLVNGFERVIHQLRGVQIGLALGGGAARGMAHLGILEALEENGIVIDMIAGTSVGAMTGVLYCSGMEPDDNVERFIKDLMPPWIFRILPNGGYWYLLWKYRLGQFDPMLRKYLKDSRLEQLTIPVQSVTVDLISGQPVIRSEGDAVHAITESINLPVLSRPINRNGQALVDGGIVNNVPADVLVNSGCNFIIAASVSASIRPEFASNHAATPTKKMKHASTISTVLRTYVVQNANMNSVGVAPADFVIQPDISEFKITEFTRADEMAEIGKATTRELIPKLRELLCSLDAPLFGTSRGD